LPVPKYARPVAGSYVPPIQVEAPPVFHRSPGQLLLTVPVTPASMALPSLS